MGTYCQAWRRRQQCLACSCSGCTASAGAGVAPGWPACCVAHQVVLPWCACSNVDNSNCLDAPLETEAPIAA